ncbi:hypothetical protein SAV31267_047090 [Streptomyces avermitilis]|uniref:Uncharacterized protein n=1 Tax=Streptomyces avermitilis TaxID=33903 RepID=A0A4D4MU06_STRAX|nr:hypothetical protein SAV31267_047090 [Streptomyces avermitilis]
MRVGPQILPYGPGLRAGQRLFGHVVQQVGDQARHRPPPPVHRGLADLRPPGHVRQIEMREPLLGQHVSGRPQHGGPHARGPASGAYGAGFGGHEASCGESDGVGTA